MSLYDNAVAVLSRWEPEATPLDHSARQAVRSVRPNRQDKHGQQGQPTDQASGQHGPHQLRDRYLELLRQRPDALDRSCLPAHLTASGIVLDPTGSATLLVLHGKLGLWVQPGGHCEDGDPTLAGAAEREVVEETGLSHRTVDPDPVLLSVHQAPCGADLHFDVQHLIVAPRDAQITVSDESGDVRWFEVDELPIELASGVPELVAAARRRLSPAART